MKGIFLKPKIILVLTIILLSLIGVSYGAWTDTLYTRGLFTTSNFHVEFGSIDDIEVSLVNVNKNGHISSVDTANTLKDKVEIINYGDKNINLTVDLGDSYIDYLSMPGNMILIDYPIQASNDSKIQDIKLEEVDFHKAYQVLTLVPESQNLIVNGINIDDEIDKNDYIMTFNLYRQIENKSGQTRALVYIEGSGIFEPHTGAFASIEYKKIENIIKDKDEYASLSKDSPTISAQLQVRYSLDISIPVEQFNND